jgi:adenylyltransferase/sulfurtransferase
LRSKFERKENLFLLDVREQNEYNFTNIGGTLIPLRELDLRTDELNKSQEIVVLCKSGIRSARAVELLLNRGFTSVKNLVGGISAWIERIDPTLPYY